MIAVKKDLLPIFKRPIHVWSFGKNKTWRGFILMPLATWPGVILAQSWERISDSIAPVLMSEASWKWALILGWGYCLAELPNSFIKRRLKISEGQTASGFLKWVFVILDQADSVIGCLVAYTLFVPIEPKIFLSVLLFGTFVHLSLNVLLYRIGVRKNPY